MGENDYSLEMPFFIDTDGYTDRDRQMFVCGYEFGAIYEWAKHGGRGPWGSPVHSENESRLKMMCGKLGLRCEIGRTQLDEWVTFEILES